MRDALYQLTVWCAPAQVPAVEARLWATGAQGIQTVDERPGLAGRRIWLAEADASVAQRALASLATQVDVQPVQAHWGDATPAAPIGRAYAVGAPTQPAPPGRQLIRLAPGLGFGHDGTHPTTRLAFALLEGALDESAPATFLDLGTGAGLLAILAARHGAQVVAVDVDGTAREAAAHNAALNGVAVSVRAAAPDALVDAAAANIRADVLLGLLPTLVDAVRPGGWLVLAGFRAAHAPRVRAHVTGWDVLQSLEEAGWLGWRVRRPRTA